MVIHETNYQPNFRDITELELYGIEKIIDELYDEGDVEFYTEILGLAYTSSSSYPMYNSTEYKTYEGHRVSHFAVGTNNTLYMICVNDDEDEVIYAIEPN